MNIYLLFNSDIANLVLKTNGVGDAGMGVGVQKALFCYYCFLGRLIEHPVFLFVMYFFCCSLVTFHLIFPCGVRDFW